MYKTGDRARFLVDGASNVARAWGVSETVITAMQTAPLAAVAASPPVAYRNVIVREHYYAPPVYVTPVYPPWHHGPYWRHPGPPRPPAPGVHWGVTIRH